MRNHKAVGGDNDPKPPKPQKYDRKKKGGKK